MAALVLNSCARALREEEEIAPLPPELEVEIRDAVLPLSVVPPEIDVTTSPTKAKSEDEAKTPDSIKGDKNKSVPSAKLQTVAPSKGGARSEPSMRSATSETALSKSSSSQTLQKSGEVAPVWPFGIGESLTLNLKYGPIEGGRAILKLVGAHEMENQNVLHFRGEIQSSTMVNLFYKVNNTIDTYVTLDQFLPLRQIIKHNESSRWGQSILRFDHKKKSAHYYSNLERHKKKRYLADRHSEIDAFSQDLFGALYFYRFLAAGKSLQFPIHDRWKSWNVEMIYVGREEVKVDAGRFPALHYRVLPKLEGMLQAKADVDVWLSDDPRRLLLKFRSKLKFGALSGELEKYVPGREILLVPPRLMTPATALAK